MKVKSFLIGFVVGAVLTALYFLTAGCGSEAEVESLDGTTIQMPDSKPLEPDILPTKRGDPTKACYDFAALLGHKMLECTMDPTLSAEWQDKLEDLLDCPGVTGLRDEEALYSECFPAIVSMSCDDLYNVEPPDSCMSQFIMR